MATPMTIQTREAARPEIAAAAAREITPPVDIYETDTSYVLLADMPGVAPDGVDIVAERDQLVIRGRVERPSRTPDYQEFELGNYYRAFALTEDLEPEKITATLRDGVLRLEIPKSPRVQPKRIAVKAQ